MRFFLDTEFNGFGGELISLALVSERGDELYLASTHQQHYLQERWVAENVMPVIAVDGAVPMWLAPQAFGDIIHAFLREHTIGYPLIVADWPDDIAYFCKCLITGPGEMVNIRTIRFDMIRLHGDLMVPQGGVRHNALWDARGLRLALTGV